MNRLAHPVVKVSVHVRGVEQPCPEPVLFEFRGHCQRLDGTRCSPPGDLRYLVAVLVDTDPGIGVRGFVPSTEPHVEATVAVRVAQRCFESGGDYPCDNLTLVRRVSRWDKHAVLPVGRCSLFRWPVASVSDTIEIAPGDFASIRPPACAFDCDYRVFGVAVVDVDPTSFVWTACDADTDGVLPGFFDSVVDRCCTVGVGDVDECRGGLFVPFPVVDFAVKVPIARQIAVRDTTAFTSSSSMGRTFEHDYKYGRNLCPWWRPRTLLILVLYGDAPTPLYP